MLYNVSHFCYTLGTSLVMKIGKMMKIYYKIRQYGLHMVWYVLCVTTSHLYASHHIAFKDVASTVMFNSLQPLPKDHFLRRLYSHLLFTPVWMQEDSPSVLATSLLSDIEEDKTLPRASKLVQDAFVLQKKVEKLYAKHSTLKEKVALEFQLSQLYKGYADYTLYGSIDWEAFQLRLHHLQTEGIKADWVTYKPAFTPVSLLEQAVSSHNLTQMFQKAKPTSYHYAELEQALCRYEQIAKSGGWGHVVLHGVLKPSKRYKSILILRERLRASGDYMGCDTPEGTRYDTCLKKAVMHFQQRHGLVADGVVGRQTQKALNVPVEVRIKEIRLNLDRIKWLHQPHAKRHIIINIPAFTLYFEEDGALRQRMKVITGRLKNPTPVFSNTVQTIVLNPNWNVPKSIIQKEMIPKLLNDPNAMAKKGIEIYEGWSKDAPKVDATSIDWSRYRYSKTMPFHFTQMPGYKNALGKVKFLFPNPYSVYMHDTPTKYLFHKNTRAFSHGCIRLQKPIALLQTFSTFNDSVDFQKVQEKLKGDKKAYLKLDNKVPVDVVYLTAYVDYNGVLQFRDDIYGYDKMQRLSYRKW